MRVAFIIGGAFTIELDLQVDPAPNNIAASLVNAVNTAIQTRPELAYFGALSAVTWAGDNFGSQDDLEAGDVELGETSSIVIWATRLRRRRKRVARTVKQVVEAPMFEGLVRKRDEKKEAQGSKRPRLADGGESVAF
jgi:hypothetical protein